METRVFNCFTRTKLERQQTRSTGIQVFTDYREFGEHKVRRGTSQVDGWFVTSLITSKGCLVRSVRILH